MITSGLEARRSGFIWNSQNPQTMFFQQHGTLSDQAARTCGIVQISSEPADRFNSIEDKSQTILKPCNRPFESV